jgi:hypothetical protein
MGIYTHVETTLTINKTDNPLRIEHHWDNS